MRNMPGWVVGAAGVGALVGAFYLGGRMTGAAASGLTDSTPSAIASAAATDLANAVGGLEVACESGQRALVRPASAGQGSTVACVSDARPVTTVVRAAYVPAVSPAADVVRVVDSGPRPYAQPAVLTTSEPTEVYRPRARRVSYEVEQPTRSVKKSVAIIAGSTAAGAVAGGLVKGKKGAVIGGLLGGGAATVWDQVTRRRPGDR